MAAPRSFEALKLGAGALLLIVVGFAVAYRYVSPAPPSTIRLGTGQPGGAYAKFGEQYRAALAAHDIDVELVHSGGTVENLRALQDGRIDIALAQAGIAPELIEGEQGEERVALESLGSLFYEPLWIVLRGAPPITKLADLRGRTLEIGPAGSGTRALATELLARNGVDKRNATWLGAAAPEAVKTLERGGADAVFIVAGVDSPLIRGLLESPSTPLLPMMRAEAYTRLDPVLSRVVLPRGVIDLARDLPAQDVPLVATVAEFVITPEFHPALVDLFLQAAERIHGGGDVFAAPGHFPNPHRIDLPLSDEAHRYFEHGPPFLQRYLPFWAATQVDRLKVMLIPLIALLIPLVRIFPPTYRWRVRSRIYRWYRQLRMAEPQGESTGAQDIKDRLAEVRRIEKEVAKVPTPTSYAEELYALRLHIDFVRRRLEAEQHSHENVDDA